MTAPDAGRVLRLAIVAWGLGHMVLGRRGTGAVLLAAELAALVVVVWLTAGLADSSAYLVPYLAGVAFLVAWAWQAVHAYRAARPQDADMIPVGRSPALAIGWLSLPLLVWGAGFWVVGAGAASPAAVLDRFVTAWAGDELDRNSWPSAVVDQARAASSGLGKGPDRFRDLRVRIAEQDGNRAIAIAEAIHYERRDTRFLWVFAGTELVAVADAEILRLDLVAEPVEMPGAGEIGAVRWRLVEVAASG